MIPAELAKSDIDLQFLRDCLKTAGDLAVGQRGQMKAEIKPDDTPVTTADHQVEDFLLERIGARYSTHQILSEESGRSGQADSAYTWVIDPIDGTRSFASGLPIWGISIGILRNGEAYAGGFYLPVTGEIYWGTRDLAFYNDQPLPRLASVDMDSVMVFLAAPSNVHLNYEITYPRIRSLGSTAAHLAYATIGAAAGVLTHRVGLWDIAGLLPVLAATGIMIETLSGKPFYPASMLDGRMAPEPLLAAHPGIIVRLRGTIQRV